MHRTKIYFEEIKKQANLLNLSLSAYIRDVLQKELNNKKQEPKNIDFSNFEGKLQ